MLGTRRSLSAIVAMRRVATRSIYRPAVYSQPWWTGLATRPPASVRTLSQGPGSQSAAATPAAPKGGGTNGGGSSSSSSSSGGGSGTSEGGDSTFIGSTTRLLVIAAAVVVIDMAVYAKVPAVKKVVDDRLTGPLPPEFYDIYQRFGVEVALPPGKSPPTREAWDMSYLRKVLDDIRRSSPFGGGITKPRESDSSGFTKKGFSVTTPAPASKPEQTLESKPSVAVAPAATAAAATVATVVDEVVPSAAGGADGSGSATESELESVTVPQLAAESESMKAITESVESVLESVTESVESATKSVKSVAAVKEEDSETALELKKSQIRSEALSGVVEEVEAASDRPKGMDNGMLQELRDMDDEALRFRVAQLSTELQERTKWEALRLMEGIKQKEADVARKYDSLLSEQKEHYETQTNKALREQEEELTASVLKKYSEQLREHLEQQAQDFKQALHANAMAGDEALRQELEAKHAAELVALKEEELKRNADEIEELRHLSYKTERTLLEVEMARKAEVDDKVASENVHRLTHAALALVETFSRSGPIKAELDNLKAIAPGDEMLEAAAGSIPADAAAKGIPTIPQLKQRFEAVKTQCRRAALVPEEAGNGLFGHLIGSVLASITFAPKGMVDGDGPEEVLARADHLLEAGELKSAVKEMDKLKGLPADVARDWMKEAKVRLTADEALRVIRSHASLLNAKHLGKA